MDPASRELLDLVFRWVHVIAAIMWIGNSLLFNWIDRNLRAPRESRTGAHGEIWLLHSGGFYLMEKTQLPGQALPRPLHWFKWQAYTTWLSGAALLIVVYYVAGGALLVDPGLSELGRTAGVAIGVGVLAVGWLVYEAIWRSALARAPGAALALSLALLLGLAYGLTQIFTGRAAFLHVGALLGTLMAGNVATTIMPAQRQLVAGVAEGGAADPALSAQAKLRSIHNNYLTFPVIVLMLGSHFPGIYGHRLSWLLLAVLLLAGAAVRHLLNIRFTYRRWRSALAGAMAVSLAALYLIARPAPPASPAPGAPIAAGEASFAAARSVIDRRCTACHSRHPSDLTFGVAPGGVAFDTPEQIRARADRILGRAVQSHTMPPGNSTRITPAERELLRRWIEQGAAIE